jgi:hypothetical protein
MLRLIARRGGGPGTRRDSDGMCWSCLRTIRRSADSDVLGFYPYPKAELTEWKGDREMEVLEVFLS